MIYAALDNKDESFKWLVFEPHTAVTAWAAVMPEFKNLHGDPRFKDFIEQLNLPD